MTAMVILVVCSVVLIGLPLLEGFFIKRTKDDRDRMLELASSMMGSPDYSDEQKELISDMLDTALDRKYMVKVVFYLPVYVWKCVSGKMQPRTSAHLLDDKFRELVRLHGRSVGAANPVFDLIFRIEIAVISLFFGFALTAIIASVLLGRIAHREARQIQEA